MTTALKNLLTFVYGGLSVTGSMMMANGPGHRDWGLIAVLSVVAGIGALGIKGANGLLDNAQAKNGQDDERP